MAYSRNIKIASCIHCAFFKLQGVLASSQPRKESARLFSNKQPVDMQIKCGQEKNVADNRKYLKLII